MNREGERPVTALEHWFLSFGFRRNRAIHADDAPLLRYERGTRYDGHWFYVPERVLRESILVSSMTLGLVEIWQEPGHRALMRKLNDLLESHDS